MTRPPKSIARLFVDRPLAPGTVTLGPDQSHYLANVMRLKAGDPLILFDDRTGEWDAVIADPHRKSTAVSLVSLRRPREAVPDLWLCAAPIRKGRVDWVAEKACELGVARFVPVLTRRTIVDRLNLDRLRAHMIEAAEQCERTALPELAETVPLVPLLSDWPAGRALIFCDEAGGEPLATLARPGPAAILIGPEGGFDPEEREAILALPWTVRASLGPRILRADTAAAAAVSIWQSVAGDWSNSTNAPSAR